MLHLLLRLPLILLGLWACSAQASSLAAPPAPQLAPAWQLQTPEGVTVDFPKAAGGRPTVLLFWPSWCPYSRALQPYVQDIWNDYKNAGVNVWTINILETGDPVQTMRDRGLTFPLLLKGDALRQTYGITRTPWLVVIDGKNRIVYTRPSNPPTPIDVAKAVRETLNGLLGSKAVPLPTSYPPPYDLHLKKPEDMVDRRVPLKLPPAQWEPWVRNYVADIKAGERVDDGKARGAIGNGSAAIAAALTVWKNQFGAARARDEAPYRAYRWETRWVVLGRGLETELGNSLIAVFDADTGALLRVVDNHKP